MSKSKTFKKESPILYNQHYYNFGINEICKFCLQEDTCVIKQFPSTFCGKFIDRTYPDRKIPDAFNCLHKCDNLKRVQDEEGDIREICNLKKCMPALLIKCPLEVVYPDKVEE